MLKVGLAGLLLRGWASLQPMSKNVSAPLALKKKIPFKKKDAICCLHFISFPILLPTAGAICAIRCERPFMRQRIPPHMACILSSPPLQGAIQASIQARVATALRLFLSFISLFLFPFSPPRWNVGFSATLHAKVNLNPPAPFSPSLPAQ